MQQPLPYQMVSLLVAQKPCLVIGGREEGVKRARDLLEAGAEVFVVARKADEAIQDLARGGRLRLSLRPFLEGDLEGMFLVLNTSRERALAERLYRLTRSRRVFLANQDAPDISDLAFPAIVRAGALRVGVSTGGASPALARRLREKLEAILVRPETERLLAWLFRKRQEIKEREPDTSRRALLLGSLLEGFEFEGKITYPLAFLREEES